MYDVTLFHDDARGGCTPPLCRSLSAGPGKSGKYPYYVVLKGRNSGIYVDWGVVEGYKDPNVVAEGCNTQADALSKWRVRCLQAHCHQPGQDDSFINPFTRSAATKLDLRYAGQGPHWSNAEDLVSTGLGYDASPSKAASSTPKGSVSSASSRIEHVKKDGSTGDQDGVIHFLIDSPHGRCVCSDRTSAHAKYLKAYEKDKRTTMQATLSMDEAMTFLTAPLHL
ncbi:hypothetical protein C8J56DRAFT_1058690 [Mycena floridula]|nr:hypothetical protein C8J56DRAFT_1058690 [Mycena floridula]